MAVDPRFSGAISGIESGGRYDVLGPVTKSGDRAYGKYQVLGSNIPQWTAQFYGQPLTPQQFLANPAAQDAVFNGKFGQYAQKYGPEGASRAWFAGEGGMNNPNAKDALGTTVAQYGQKFMAGLGPQYAAVNSPPLIPGTQAPPLPPPITIGGNPQAPLPAAAPQQQQQQLPASAGGQGLLSQVDTPIRFPEPAPNPIQQIAMQQPPPNTRGLQQLLSQAPVLRGLLV